MSVDLRGPLLTLSCLAGAAFAAAATRVMVVLPRCGHLEELAQGLECQLCADLEAVALTDGRGPVDLEAVDEQAQVARLHVPSGLLHEAALGLPLPARRGVLCPSSNARKGRASGSADRRASMGGPVRERYPVAVSSAPVADRGHGPVKERSVA